MPQAQSLALPTNAGVTIGNSTIPAEGPKTIPLRLDFTTQPLYSVDPLALYQQGTLSLIQGVWVDNSNNGSPLTVSIASTKQNIVIAPGDQGFYPVLSPKSGDIQFFTMGGVVLDASLYNVPLPASQWSSTGGASFAKAPGGALQTQDTGLAQIIDPAKGLLVQGGAGGGGGNYDQFAYNAQWPGDNNGSFVLMQRNDADVKDYYATHIVFGITPDAYLAAGGRLLNFYLRSNNSTDTYGAGRVYVPGAAPVITSPQGVVPIFTYENPNGFKINKDGAYAQIHAEIDGYGSVPQLAAGEYVSTVSGFTIAH